MNSIVVKLGLSIIFLLLAVLLPLGYVVNQVFSNFYYQKAVQELNIQSDKLVQLIKEGNDMAPGIIIAMQMVKNGVFVVDSQKKVVIHANTDLDSKDIILPNDWARLLEGKKISKEIKINDHRVVAVAEPIMKRNDFNGAVVMVTSMDDIENSISMIRNVLILSGTGALLLALGFTVLMVRKLSVPLLNMERAAKTMAKGDLGVRVHVNSNDEIGSLAKAINELASNLKRFEDTRKEFFVNISHELRTPLTYIEGYVGLLTEEIDEQQKKELVPIIKNETKRLKRLVDDLFDLSQLEEGKISLILEWIDLSEVIASAYDNVNLRAKKHSIELVLKEEEIPLLYLDGYRMQQVFINLLDNAIRYTRSGTIMVELSVRNEKVVVQITDTGIGIPKEELPFIFERFHRVEKSRSREYGGTGLGLAIVKKLVELQGGTISVESTLGEGTTFLIQFPIGNEERGK